MLLFELTGLCLPKVPSTSGWPSWPIKIISLPALTCRLTSLWTFVTKGQVASKETKLYKAVLEKFPDADLIDVISKDK